MNKFLDDVVIPYFNGFKSSENIDICLFSADNILLATSQVMPRKFQFDFRDLIGKSLKSLDSEIIKKICNVDDDNLEDVLNELEKVALLNDIVVKDKITLKYIDLLPYKNYFDAMLVIHIPIFDPRGEVVAIQILSTTYYLFGLSDYLQTNAQFFKSSSALLKPIKVQKTQTTLSIRQHEVLFLLLSGMTQTDIATFLELKRGTISTVVHNLCNKFNIEGANTQLLLKAARKHGFHHNIPDSLRKPRFIILDPEVRAKYLQLGNLSLTNL